ncbi:positive regulation of nitrogen compound metabolic process [Blastocladiella emersonii ATCC 22665]|nr:positive regulation of nitrogen compound metabolic process [Blastocladiella emersonii ATCC 22665]
MGDTIEVDARKVRAFVRLALFSEASRSGLKRADITTHVFNKTSVTGNTYNHYLGATNDVLKSNFGLTLVELQSSSSGKVYILKNAIPAPLRIRAGLMSDHPALLGVAFSVLAIIYVHGSKIRDDDLAPKLIRLGIKRDGLQGTQRDGDGEAVEEDDDAYGVNPLRGVTYDVLMKDLAKQGYVKRTVMKNAQGNNIFVGDSSTPLHENVWGPRAQAEMTEANVRSAIAHLYGCTPGTAEYDRLMDELKKASSM